MSNSQILNGVTFDVAPEMPGVILSNTISNNTSETLEPSIGGGFFTWNQVETGTAYKKIVIYCNGLIGAVPFTFATAFTNAPVVMTTSGLSSSLVSSITTTGATITGTPVTGSTGFLFLEGF